MPLWLLKLIPKKFLVEYWKYILGFVIITVYTTTLTTCVKNDVNTKWELKDVARIKAQQIAETVAALESTRIKALQDANTKALTSKLKLDKKAAEDRATKARAAEAEQRRLSNESTSKLEEAIASKPTESTLLDDGVRDILNRVQDQVRSRRHP